MNYHIMIQEKFLESFIEDIYAIGEAANNVFWFRGNKNDSTFFSTSREVEYLGTNKHYWKQRLSKLSPADNVFIHWYDAWAGDLVADIGNRIFVHHWGGEFFGEPFWFHAKWIHDEKTYKILKRNTYPRVAIRKNVLRMIKQLFFVWRFNNRIKAEYERKNRHMARIDYVIFSEYNKADLHKSKELFPGFRAVHLSGFYDLNFDLAASCKSKTSPGAVLKILVGNSATEANNHTEAFLKIAELKGISYEVYCPLSYGSEYYRKIVIEHGRKLFGERFHPMLEFLSRDRYVNFLNEMDLVFMYHNRTQGWGNVATALTLGKPVFLKDRNNLKAFVEAIGIKTFDARLIDRYDLRELIEESHHLRSGNVARLKEATSQDKRLNDLKNLMSFSRKII
jgi:dTDP-N-acetylfucosamine:lipid II N-acetylfucosaminyltransferase